MQSAKKKEEISIHPLRESNPQRHAHGSDTLPLSHSGSTYDNAKKKHIHKHTESVTRELPKFSRDSKGPLIYGSTWLRLVDCSLIEN